MDKLLVMLRFSNGGLDSEPDGIESGQKNERKERSNRSSTNERVGQRSPEDRERQRNECKDRSQCCEDNWSGPLDGGFHDSMKVVEPLILICLDLTDQDERITHQYSGQGN